MLQDPHTTRIELAKSLTPLWTESGALCAIVGGSTAKLMADQFSDLEIAIYYKELPNDQMRRNILESINAIQSFPFISLKPDHWQIEDSVTIKALRVDIIHCKFDVLNDWMKRLLENHDPDLGIQAIAAALKTGEILFGPNHLNPLKYRVKNFPEKLALEIFNRLLPTIGVSQLQIAEYRGDRHMFYAILSAQHRRLLQMLFAINREFYPGDKNAAKSISRLKILTHTHAALNTLYDLPAKNAQLKFEEVVDEIVAECKRQFTDVDLEMLETKRKNARKSWP